ncbi:MAG TPA: HNH endonuclease [Methylococcaceae bacterium]|nr:HNH endonuclease [Methylococcaceae bacterium]
MAFGEVDGYPEGSLFESRDEVRVAGLHRHLVKGIAGRPDEGADAIVLNQGYEDDVDYGDLVIYTGEGGNDSSTGRQIADQKLTAGNAALVTSELNEYPIRVIRGYKLKSPYAPQSGYRYDGLYFVKSHWTETGKSGFEIIRFELNKFNGHQLPPHSNQNLPLGNDNPEVRPSVVNKVVRDRAVTRSIKEMYDDKCQVCGIQLACEGGNYSEGAHIKPISKVHGGADKLKNILCLCPNHHAQFDRGGFCISDDFSLIGIEGRLNVHPEHQIEISNLQYHRNLFPSLLRDG